VLSSSLYKTELNKYEERLDKIKHQISNSKYKAEFFHRINGLYSKSVFVGFEETFERVWCQFYSVE